MIRKLHKHGKPSDKEQRLIDGCTAKLKALTSKYDTLVF
jgi:hypothetical protein